MNYKIPYTFLLISFTFLFYVIFKSEFQWDGQRRDYYQIYYILSICFVIFSIFVFFLNHKINLVLFVCFLSSLTSVYLFEFYTNFLKINNNLNIKNKILIESGKKEFDKRTINQVYKDLKKIDNDTTLAFYPEYFVYKKKINFLPLSGKSNSKTLLCNENGKWIVYNSDKYGFRNTNEDWDKNIIDFLIVGDSFAQGFCVNDNNHLASQIKKISNKNVINIGYGSNGPLLEYASVVEYLPKNTKNLLWFYYEENDLENLEIELKNNLLIEYLENKSFKQYLKEKQKLTDTIIENEIKRNLNFKTTIFNFIKIKETRKIIKNLFIKKNSNIVTNQDKIFEQFTKIILLTKELLSKENTKLYFIYLPEYSRYSDINYNNKNYEKILNFLNENKIKYLDVHAEIFLQTKNPKKFFPFELHGHYTEYAYNLIANRIINKFYLR